jgi:hypothetical protein
MRLTLRILLIFLGLVALKLSVVYLVLVLIAHMSDCSVLAPFALPHYQEAFTDYETREYSNSGGERTSVCNAEH